MSAPLFVIVNVAVPVLIPLHAPVTDKADGIEGVEVGVLVGVLVGRFAQEPTVLNVTEERIDVLYVTVMVA